MCKGMGDLECRFGNPPDARMDRERIVGPVKVVSRAYAQDTSRPAGGGR